MKRPRLIIADEDESYIISLQLHIVQKMFDKVDLEIITDRNYYNELFATPQKVDVLIVSEKLYRAELQKQDIRFCFVLVNSSSDLAEYPERIVPIYKYTSVKEIFEVIRSKTENLVPNISDTNNSPQIILVTSASGGVGKTTVAMGMASALSSHMKKTLYINTDHLQSFQCLLINETPIVDNVFYMDLATDRDDAFSKIKHLIRKEDFYYIPPFKEALLSLGIPHSIGIDLARQAKQSGEYDFIIVDADSSYDSDKAKLIELADKVIFVTTQNDASVFALQNLISNIDLPDKEKQIFVCNRFNASKRNALLEKESELGFFVSNYIEDIDEYWKLKNKKFSTVPGINRISMMLI